MATCGGRTKSVRVGDLVHILDDNKYRVLTFTPTPAPVVLKIISHTTYQSFPPAQSQLLISAPRMVIQSAQTDPQPTDTVDPTAGDVFQCCSPAALEAYHQGHFYCLGDIHWITPPKPIHSHQQQFVGYKLQEGNHYDKHKEDIE